MSTEPLWRAVKATGGVTFVEKQVKGRYVARFALRFDDGEAERIAQLLNQLDKSKPTKEKSE
jgi:hypothetical protein